MDNCPANPAKGREFSQCELKLFAAQGETFSQNSSQIH